MFDVLFDILRLFSNQIIIGILLCVCAALVGVILVLKRFSMIGDGLSHVSFSIFAIALCFNINQDISLLITIPLTVFVAYFLLIIGQKTKIKGDSAIALVSTSALAIAYLFLYKKGGSNNIEDFLFGSVLTASKTYLYFLIPISFFITVFFILFYNRIFAVTFDETFAKATGVKVKLYNFLFAVFSATIISVGMRILGTLLISAIIVFPALGAMRLSNSFRKVLILSVILSALSFLIGFIGFYSLSAGPGIVVANLGVFLICCIIGALKRRIN